MAPDSGSSLSKYKLDRLFLKRFWRCWKVIFPGCLSTTFLLLILLMGLSLADQMLMYNTGLIPSRFYEALLDRNKADFISILISSSPLILGAAVANSAVKYDSRILYVKWRGLLDRKLHSGYFKHKAYYKLNVLQDKVDNIDQRITQDVEKFCNTFRSFLLVLIISPFTVAYYTYLCYQSLGYLGPVCIYVYFIVGAIIDRLILTPIVGVVVKQEKLEGDFRFKHMQIRSNAESIAFYRSGELEMKKSNSKLQSVLQTQLRVVNLQCIMFFFITFIDSVGSILSYFIIAIALFAGNYDDLSVAELGGQISRSSFYALYLITCGTNLINLSNDFSYMAGYVHRIGQLLESLAAMETDSEEKTTENEDSLGEENLAPHRSDAIFKLINVSIAPPNCSDPLVKELDLEINHGKSILITGNAGSGKSSLFRILCGIWSPLSGKVLRFLPLNPKAVFVLPQKTFLTDGTLRQQLTYPCEDSSHGDASVSCAEGSGNEKLLELLEIAGLTPLISRVGGLDNPVDYNWMDILSPGEMQRLSFARLFFHRPLVALLDEATSTLDVASETKLYSACKQLGITVVSVGHRESLRELHDFHLKLDGVGGWEFKKIRDE